MLTRDDLFIEYQSAIVSACNPSDPPGEGWSDPALFAAMAGRSCVVMTAWNPGFQRPSAAVNEAANQKMAERLEALGLEVWDAECASPDGNFREPAFLIWDMPIADGLNIAAQFAQFAIYAYSAEGARTVVSTQSDSASS